MRKIKKMKILITYFSNTGNTEKVANAIKEGLEGHDVEIKKVDDTNSESLKDYDLVFLGSGIYAGNITKAILDLLKNADALPPKFALFCTHASPDFYQNGFKMVKNQIAAANSEVIGEWDCMGENIGLPKDMQMKMMANLPPEKQEQAKKHMESLKGRPNTEDLEEAKAFAALIIK